MLNVVTWKQFGEVVICAGMLYYGLITLLYKRLMPQIY